MHGGKARKNAKMQVESTWGIWAIFLGGGGEGRDGGREGTAALALRQQYFEMLYEKKMDRDSRRANKYVFKKL